MSINILILAAGNPGYEAKEDAYPLSLTEFDGVSLIEKLVSNTLKIQNAQYTFALRKDEVEHYHLDRVVELLTPGAKVVQAPKVTRGSACTVLLAASQFDPTQEVLVVSANELVDIDFNSVISDFRERNLAGGTLTFRSIQPRYSYVRLGENKLVVEVAQKKPISNYATTGVFWYAQAGYLVEAIKDMIRKDANVDGDFYVAPAFNEMILKQGRIGIREIDAKQYRPLKTEKQIYQFEQVASI